MALFHASSLTHYHFIYDIERGVIEGKPVAVANPDWSYQNFPVKSFFNADLNEVYSFYRQGQAFTINLNNLNEFRLEQLSSQDLGEMFMIYDKSLVVRSSSFVLFFKQVEDEVTGKRSWSNYFKLNQRGSLYYIKGNVRM